MPMTVGLRWLNAIEREGFEKKTEERDIEK
jgi:hypothetical protein